MFFFHNPMLFEFIMKKHKTALPTEKAILGGKRGKFRQKANTLMIFWPYYLLSRYFQKKVNKVGVRPPGNNPPLYFLLLVCSEPTLQLRLYFSSSSASTTTATNASPVERFVVLFKPSQQQWPPVGGISAERFDVSRVDPSH
jgi:hypothetical protein